MVKLLMMMMLVTKKCINNYAWIEVKTKEELAKHFMSHLKN